MSSSLQEQLLPESQFYSAERALKIMAEKYFSRDSEMEWPKTIRKMQDDGDHLGLTPANDWKLALKSMGASIWYLTRCLVDEQIMAMARFVIYTPPDNIQIDENEVAKKIARIHFNRHMVIDSITVANLKITDKEMSLLSTLDHCATKFGKRLLQNWVCSPSCERDAIVDRQSAIQELMNERESLQDIRSMLTKLPDLERQLSQIHTFGNLSRAKNHPDGRAIFFEAKIYNKKKIQDFISTLKGFEALTMLPNKFSQFSSKLLIQLSQLSPKGEFPNMDDTIEFFKVPNRICLHYVFAFSVLFIFFLGWIQL